MCLVWVRPFGEELSCIARESAADSALNSGELCSAVGVLAMQLCCCSKICRRWEIELEDGKDHFRPITGPPISTYTELVLMILVLPMLLLLYCCSKICRRWEIELEDGKDHFRPITGLPISTYFSAYKFQWLQEHVPEVSCTCEGAMAS